MKLYLLPGLVVALCACQRNTVPAGAASLPAGRAYELRGQLGNAPAGTRVFLTDTGTRQRLDSATVDAAGSFTLQRPLPGPAVYGFGVSGQRESLLLPLAPADHVQLSAIWDNLVSTARYTGTPAAADWQLLADSRNQTTARFLALGQAQVAAGKPFRSFDARLLAPEQQREQQVIRQLTRAHAGTYLGPYWLLQLDRTPEQAAFIDSLTTVFAARQPASGYTRQLQQRQQATTAQTAGATAPDINLPTPGGQTLALSSLRGKYVLLDFWASWCGPCRAESPNLRKIYQQFHSRGLEIYSVSLDADRKKWLKAIENDQFIWPQVSDLNGWESAGARAYNVTAIPFNVLLDPQGRVLAQNLHGRELGQKIASYIPLD